VNVALIFAIALVISGIKSPRDSVKRDFPFALMIPFITGILLLDGELSRFDGCLMLVMFFIWITMAVMEARKQRSAAEIVLGVHRLWRIILYCVAGLLLLVLAGKLIVAGAGGIAKSFGIDEFIIGATIVAVGTSMPEFATTIIAKLRGYDEISLGTILGSNIFNGIFITAIAAIIHPIVVDWREVSIALAFGFLALVITYPSQNDFIGRKRGVVLLGVFAIYLAMVINS
jgi:cation:H+ antiporter